MVKGEVVNDTSLSLVAICQSDGLFSEITDWPGCRGAISCDAFPVPDTATTYLMPSQSQQVVEYEYAVYSCKDGAMLEGNNAEELSKCEIRQSTIRYDGSLGRWDKRLVDQASDVPSIFFFIKSCKILCKNPFNLFFHFFYKIMKRKIKKF